MYLNVNEPPHVSYLEQTNNATRKLFARFLANKITSGYPLQ